MRFEAADILQEYHKEIDKYSQLTKEEEFELAQRIQASTGAPTQQLIRGRLVDVYPEPTDQEALHQLVTANLKFGVTMANKFIGNNVPLGDLIGSGCEGLIKAAKRYNPVKGDPKKDVRFITFAVWYLQKHINNEVEETSRIVRIPKNQSLDMYLKRKAGEEVVTRNTVELDKPISDDSDNTVGDMLLKAEPEILTQFETEERNKHVHVLMSILTEQEKNVIRLRFGFDGDEEMSNKEVAEELNLSLPIVSRIVRSAYTKMREQNVKLERREN
jgi:RNA polymerase primary sigma factor